MTLSDAPAKEAFAAITAGSAIMFTCGFIATDCAVGVHAIFSLTDVGLCRHIFCEQQQGRSEVKSSLEQFGLSCSQVREQFSQVRA